MSKIPKIIHQSWKDGPETLRPEWKSSYETWKSLEKDGFTYMYWNDNDIYNFMEVNFPWFMEQFKSYKYGIQRCDVFRTFVLYKYGGIYSDFDQECKPKEFKQFYEYVKHYDVAVSKVDPEHKYKDQNFTNSFMMSAPNSPFWEHVWEYLKDPTKDKSWKKIAIKQTNYFHVIFTTGPGIISDAVETYTGEIYRIPAEFTQPSGSNYPINTTESVVKVLPGSSWHTTDAKFYNKMGKVVDNWIWILYFFLGLFFLLFIYFLWKYKKLKKHISRKQVIRG